MMTQMFTRSNSHGHGNNLGSGGGGAELQDGRNRTNVNVRHTSPEGRSGPGPLGRLMPHHHHHSSKSKSFDQDEPAFLPTKHHDEDYDHEPRHEPAHAHHHDQQHVRIQAPMGHDNSDSMSCFSTRTEEQHQKLVSCFQDEIQKMVKKNKRLEVKVRLHQKQQEAARHEAMDAVQRATEQSLRMIQLQEENAALKNKLATALNQLSVQAHAAQDLEEFNEQDGFKLPPRHHHGHGHVDKHSHQDKNEPARRTSHHSHGSHSNELTVPQPSGSRHMLMEAQNMVRESLGRERSRRDSYDESHGSHSGSDGKQEETASGSGQGHGIPQQTRMSMLRQAGSRVDRLLFSGRNAGNGATPALTEEEQEEADRKDTLRKTVCMDRPASRALHQWLEKQDRKECHSFDDRLGLGVIAEENFTDLHASYNKRETRCGRFKSHGLRRTTPAA